MVQIGNEIANGMLWNDDHLGRHEFRLSLDRRLANSTGLNRLADLLSEGIKGARDGAGPGDEPLIMIHHDKGSQWDITEYYFDELLPATAITWRRYRRHRLQLLPAVPHRRHRRRAGKSQQHCGAPMASPW